MTTSECEISRSALSQALTQTGETLAELSRRGPVLVVFLRHAGCTFCRQALADLSACRPAVTSAGVTIALVHMETDSAAAALFARYRLEDVPRISDPEQDLYRAFRLGRGRASQVVGVRVWGAGLKSLLAGHLPGVPGKDVWQMPGAFLLHDGRVLRAFRHATSGDRPDYLELAGCPVAR